ncbi:hypothetical protein [Ktedonospora formicarum]|uniref:hypothetical protein n=1 Tax=Ktedonospora formicarum TaxID=2778364 RepID=UPI001C68950B|nr:hypothetical protein [Ktedonospora formicarum]
MDELEASSLQPPHPTNVQNNQLQRPFSEKSGLAILPASNPKENVAIPVGAGGSNTTSATMLASSPMPVMPPPLIPQTPHYLRSVSPEVDANAQWKPLAEKQMHMRRRKGLVVGIGIAISFICLLLLGVSVLPLLLPKSDTKQGLEQTPTIPAVTVTQTHGTPTAQPSIQPTATATHEVKPTPTATPSPTPSPTKPPPTPTPPPSTPTPKPTHTPKPTPTPCWLFC